MAKYFLTHFTARLRDFSAFLYSRPFKHAIKTAIAAVICLILYKSFHLPKGYWAVLTAIVVMQATADTGSLESTFKLAWHRLLGTMTGACIGLAIHVLMTPNYWQLIVIIFVLIMLGVYATYLWPTMKLAGVTAVIVLLCSGHQPMSHNIAIIRAAEILVGASIALAVSVLIWPQRMHQHLYQNFIKHMRQILDVFLALEKAFALHQPLTSEQLQAISHLLNHVDSEKSHLSDLMKTRKMAISNILSRQIRLLKNIKLISRSVGLLPDSYYDHKELMIITHQVFHQIKLGLEAIIVGDIAAAQLDAMERVLVEFDLMIESYREQKSLEQLSMNASFAIVSISIALKKMLDLVAELNKSIADAAL